MAPTAVVITSVPVVVGIINHSLGAGTVPDNFKTAYVTPLTKKSSLDPSKLENYQPIYSITFLSKVLERVVDAQLSHFIADNILHEKIQSAYCGHHSTETALMRVHNDILLTLSDQMVCLLILLDLSATFVTVDHGHLLHALQNLSLAVV